MKLGFLAGALAATVAVIATTCTYQVSNYEYAIVTRLGAPQRATTEAGLHFKWPAPIDAVVRVDGRMQILDPAGKELLTGDIKNLIVDTFMIWSVKDPLTYWTSLGTRETADARLTDMLLAVASDVVGLHDFAEIIQAEQVDGRGVQALGDEITKIVGERAMESFGIEVHAVRIKRLNFPAQNKQAIFSRMQAGREKVAKGLRAEGYEEAEKIEIDTDAQVASLQAEASLAAARTLGAAEAEATRLFSEAIALDPEFFEFLRRIEVLETGLGSDSLLILPSDHELLKALLPASPASPPNGDRADKEKGGE